MQNQTYFPQKNTRVPPLNYFSHSSSVKRCLFASSEQSDVEDISEENAQDFDRVPIKLLKKSHLQLLQKQIPVLPKKTRGHKGKTGNNNYFIWESEVEVTGFINAGDRNQSKLM